jgi:hypothetical protein
MSFSEFLGAIQSPALRHVAEHWNTVRSAKHMPAWSGISPKAISAELPLVWAYKYDSATDTFTGRLSGDRIVEIYSKNFRGVDMRNIYPSKDYPRLFARSKRIITEPALYHDIGLVFRHVERYGKGERIVMPLAENGVTGDGLFGATYYEALAGAPSHDDSEVETWFAL